MFSVVNRPSRAVTADGSHAHDGPQYPPRDHYDRRPVAIDIYNNYITNAHDNSIEMDGRLAGCAVLPQHRHHRDQRGLVG